MGRADGVPRSATSLAIGHVVGVCADVEMVWVDARRGVAAVTANQSVGDCSVVQLVRETVRHDRATDISHSSVAEGVLRAQPEPATIRLLDAIPESLRRRWRTSCVGTVSTRTRAVLAAPFIRMLKDRAALQTGTLEAHRNLIRCGAAAGAVTSSARPFGCPILPRASR